MTCTRCYDALVSINVPLDKARAVVDAMQRDRVTTLATKSDLALLQKDLDAKYLLLRQEFESTRAGLGHEIENTRVSLRQEIESWFDLLSKDIEASRKATIIWLGSGLIGAVSVILTASA